MTHVVVLPRSINTIMIIRNVIINKLRTRQYGRYTQPSTEFEFILSGTPFTNINKRTRSLRQSELVSSNLIAINALSAVGAYRCLAKAIGVD